MVNLTETISSHHAEFSYSVYFKLVDFSTDMYIIYRSNIYMALMYTKSSKKNPFHRKVS